MIKFVALCSLVAVASAGLLPVIQQGYGHEDNGPAQYEFSYSVHDPHTGDVKEQTEKRDGHSVSGHYSLVEPDGHRRIVHYTADEHNGFNAQVTREGENRHIQQQGNLGHVAKVLVAPIAIGHSNGGYSNGYSNGGHGQATSHSTITQHNTHQSHY